MNHYNEINAHQRDKEIHFESSTHTYTHNQVVFKSVTTVVEEFFEPFDKDYWAAKKAPLLGKTPEELKMEWEKKGEIARTLGTQMHEKIERHYLGLQNEDDETYALFKWFTQYYHLEPYRTEWAIYDEESRVAGTLDFLQYKDGVFTIYDWKRSNKIVVNGKVCDKSHFGKFALKPISHLPDTTYWHYALQVSIYRYILEKNYGIQTQKGSLAIFHPENKRPWVVEVPYLRQEVVTILKTLSEKE